MGFHNRHHPEPINAMTVDLEDWGQAVLDPRLPVTPRVVENVYRLLDFLDAHKVRATFFALGRVCEQYPDLLPAVAAAGHEIGSHGYGHELIYNLTPEQFEADIRQATTVIESQSGRRPIGYRAPAFSITNRSSWAGPILSRNGFCYSSSIFPVRKRRYGIPDAPRFPYRWADCDLWEFPLTTVRLAGWNLPLCGGGYTRLLPAALMAAGIRSLNRQGRPAILYLHPYEMATGEVSWFRQQGYSISSKRYFMQSLWRSRVPARLGRLFAEFRFASVGEVLRLNSIDDPAQTPEDHPELCLLNS
ncbi:MAG: DUF3473 domain-containing protein [Phycisphaerales bacterium]|nr:DUF3473 domain-containing protein [Phycisphaerales bacterium]